jgi:pSer/pThr/pTyr-binding forkhead associated (FHA) protein
MATNTLLQPPQDAIASPVSDELPTAQLDPVLAPLSESLTRLHFRSAERSIPRVNAAPGHYIAFDSGDGQRLLALDCRILHLGRSAGSDVRFEDPHVSRRHAIIVRYGRHVRVLDDRSSGGTFVNGVRVIATDLSDGDVVRLGPIVFTYLVVR